MLRSLASGSTSRGSVLVVRAQTAEYNVSVKLDRRTFVVAGPTLFIGCDLSRSTSMARVRHHPLAPLPTTTLPWLSLRDHFVATVGPHAGRGKPFGPLLVLADATFAPRSRFPLHAHEEMEILSIVLDGELSHHGDQAHGASLPARSAQLISARRGMTHAEGNETDRPTRMLQIWIEPDARGGPPAYYQRELSTRGRQIVAGDDVMPLLSDARVWWIDLAAGGRENVSVAADRQGYLLALDGEVSIVEPTSRKAALALAAGDGLEVGEGTVEVHAQKPCAILWLDVPARRAR